jgi:hypothetical protein
MMQQAFQVPQVHQIRQLVRVQRVQQPQLGVPQRALAQQLHQEESVQQQVLQ